VTRTPAPDARSLAADALEAVERGTAFAKDLLEERRASLADPRDRGLLTEVVYGALRRRGTLDALLRAACRSPLPRLDPAVRAALRVALYQVLFLERVPPHAAVDAAVEHAKARTNPRFAGFVNGVLRGLVRGVEGPVPAGGAPDDRRDVPRPGAAALRLRRPTFPDPAHDEAGNLAERYAHPAWLVRRWLARHGRERARAMLEAGASRPPTCLRARPGARAALLAELRAAGVDAREGAAPDAVVAAAADAAALAPVLDGRAAVQDETAQRVAPLLDVRAGDRLLDLCAAPGTKATHLLDLLDASEGRGEVVACDVDAAKVAALADALARRASAASGSTRGVAALVPERGPLPFAPGSFDGVLVDAPCSNTGVLRRRVEARDRLRESDVRACADAQAAILDRAAPLVRPGGRLVYSTCSAEPEEDEDVVAAFLARHPGWARGAGFDVPPSLDADGGFAAVLLAPRSTP
jgi:16S rRNA (cytosine967-C5)-methyltransferase